MRRERDHFVPLLGRVLLTAIFLGSGLAKIADWSGSAGYMASKGLPAIPVLLVAAIVIEVGGGLLLLLGLRAREAALVMALYLVPVTLVFHDFWALAGMERTMQMANFMKNLAIIGGLFYVFAYGPGRISLDDRVRTERSRVVTPRIPAEPTEA